MKNNRIEIPRELILDEFFKEGERENKKTIEELERRLKQNGKRN